jgi:hypothetical protein
MKIVSRKAAIMRGRMFYCTGKRCKRGHRALRYVKDQSCVACREENMATASAAERTKKSAGQKRRRRRARIAIEALARLGVSI